jgi:vacuolar-type H+-ATPase subunit I/STV1
MSVTYSTPQSGLKHRVDRIFSTLVREVERLGDEEEIETSSCPCVLLPFFSDDNDEGYKFRVILKILISATLMFGLISLVIGLRIGLKSDLSNDGDLVAYILFGFGLFTTLVSSLGLVGAWKRNREFLRVVSRSIQASTL